VTRGANALVTRSIKRNVALIAEKKHVSAGFRNGVHALSNSTVSLFNCIGGAMVSVFASSAVDRGFKPRSGQTKNYEIGICYFSAKHAILRRKSKDWLTRNQDNMSEWGDIVFLWTVVSVIYKNPTKPVGLEQSGHHHHHLI
jgi:hypothetical protein